MYYDKLETDIQARLVDQLPNTIEIMVLPEKENDYTKPLIKSRVTIVYSDSTFDKVQSTAQISQEEIQKIDLVIESRFKRGSLGIHDVFDKVRSALIGFQPENCSRIYAVTFDFVKHEQNVWTYAFTIACKDMLIELYEEEQDEIIPTLNTVTTNETIIQP